MSKIDKIGVIFCAVIVLITVAYVVGFVNNCDGTTVRGLFGLECVTRL